MTTSETQFAMYTRDQVDAELEAQRESAFTGIVVLTLFAAIIAFIVGFAVGAS